MKKVNIFLGNEIVEPLVGDIIAVDSFAMTLINAGYKDFISIGDFDSCKNDQEETIKLNSKMIKHPVEKDMGDLELALNYAANNGYSDVVLYNINCGKRIDHFINNILILKKYNKLLNITVKDNNNLMYFLNNHNVIEKSNYSYYSLIVLEDTQNLFISSEFKYSFSGSVDKFDTRFISNELVENKGIISYDSGDILLIMSKD